MKNLILISSLFVASCTCSSKVQFDVKSNDAGVISTVNLPELIIEASIKDSSDFEEADSSK